MTTPEPISEDVGVQENTELIKILPMIGKISSYQTGRFPVTYNGSGKYIMATTDYDSEDILEEPLKSNTNTELLYAVTKLYQHLKVSGLQPHLHMLEN